MKRVTGIGGIFFKSDHPERLYRWYEKHLGMVREPHGQGSAFHWREVDDPEKDGFTAWGFSPATRSTLILAGPCPSHDQLSGRRSGCST